MQKINVFYSLKLWIVRSLLVCLFPHFVFFEIAMFGDTFQGLTIILCCNLSLIALICFVFKKGYQKTTIGIDQNSVTYDHDFLWKKRKDVLFRDIKEIELKAGLLQKIFGLGTIVLHTHATVSGNRQSGIALRDLENGEKIYTELKQMINQAKSEK